MPASTRAPALYVRLAADEADTLDRAVAATGKTKRQLVGEAVRVQLSDDKMVVGRVELREKMPEVLLPGEAAALLRLDEAVVLAAAEAGELPGRKVGAEWRFGRDALIAWLGRP